MLATQGDLQSQLAAKDKQMKALIEQVAQLTPIVKALTKKVTEANDGGGSLRKRTQVRSAAADKENQGPNAKTEAGKDTRPPWLLKMSNMGGYCWSCGYNHPTPVQPASARRRDTKTTRRRATEKATAKITNLSEIVMQQNGQWQQKRESKIAMLPSLLKQSQQTVSLTF